MLINFWSATRSSDGGSRSRSVSVCPIQFAIYIHTYTHIYTCAQYAHNTHIHTCVHARLSYVCPRARFFGSGLVLVLVVLVVVVVVRLAPRVENRRRDGRIPAQSSCRLPRPPVAKQERATIRHQSPLSAAVRKRKAHAGRLGGAGRSWTIGRSVGSGGGGGGGGGFAGRYESLNREGRRVCTYGCRVAPGSYVLRFLPSFLPSLLPRVLPSILGMVRSGWIVG